MPKVGADGSILIDASINSNGINTGVGNIKKSVGGLMSSLKGLAGVVGLAFGVAAVKKFVTESNEAYKVQLENEVKLATVMQQRMGATTESVQSILDLTAAEQQLGVIGDEVQIAGAQQVSTFLTETDSLKSLIPAMNNLLAQQNGVNATTSDAVNIGNLMGKVMQGQTSALTRVGVTFSAAEEQILKYGTEQERAAMLAQVITNNVGEMNKTLAQTDVGRQQQLSNTFGDIKEQFGAAFTQISILFLPVLQKVAEWLSYVAALARQVAQALANAFGGSSEEADNTTSSISASVNNQEALTDAVNDTAKAQKKAVAGFDTVQKLSENTSAAAAESASTGASASAGGQLGEYGIQTKVDFSNITDVVEKIKSVFSAFKKWFDENISPIIAFYTEKINPQIERLKAIFKKVFADIGKLIKPLIKWFDTLTVFIQTCVNTIGIVLTGLFTTFNTVFSDIWNLAVFPIIDKFVKVILPLITQVATQVVNTLGNLFTVINSIFNTIWSGVIAPVIGFITAAWGEMWDTVYSVWQEYGASIFEGINGFVASIEDIFTAMWENYLQPVFKIIGDVVTELWDKHLKPLWDDICDFIASAIDNILKIWNKFLAPFIEWIWGFLGPVFVEVFNNIANVVGVVVGTVIDVVRGLIKFFKGVIDFFTGVFTLDWDKAWKGIKEIFGGIWGGLWSVVKGVVNLITNGINLLWKGIYTVVKAIVDTIGGIAGALGDMFGQDWHFSMPTEPPLIPKLATGAVVPPNREFMAVLGDNKRETEIVSPLSTMKQAFKEAFAEVGNTGSSQAINLHVTAQVDGNTLFEVYEKVKANKGLIVSEGGW